MDTLALAGKRVIATGASRGIGRAIATAFARNGAHVSVCGRDRAALAETEAAIAACGVRAHAQMCDVSDAAALEAYLASAAAELGGVDVLVNNASAFAREDDDAVWRAAFDTDLMPAVRAARSLLPRLAESGAGAVVHVASISGVKATPNAMPYGALKAALIQLTKSQAWAFAARGVRVNAVAPGSVEFPGHFWVERRERDDPAYAAAVSKIPFGRMGAPDEIANVAVFLASPRASWVTGQTLLVDGGQTLSP